MSLIKCPECEKEISDKSDKCIHCGYPIRNMPYICEKIMGKDFDVSFLLDHSVSQAKQIKQLADITGCDLFTAKKIVLKYHPTIQEEYSNQNGGEVYESSCSKNVKCPYCHSYNTSKISTFSKAMGMALLGVYSISRNSKQWHCNKCGSDF